ncbi:MAG: LysR family transcriptional regulator [Thermodesulfobacteriota bacterium]|nr:LysR family transcriptional regulator [Thermodesulfobacteriota bacterium]
MHINLNQLRAFFLAARERSITKAAESLYVTQPAVTMQIKSLEQDLGVKLFRKFGKNLELTGAGNVLFGYAEKIFEIVEEMEYVLKGHADSTHGSLTIGTTRSFARHLMPGLLSRFQKRFPKVKVILKVGSSQEIADGVLDFVYDVGTIGRLPYKSRLNVIPYSREEFCLVVSPQHRFSKCDAVSLCELEKEPIIIREEGSGSRYAILSLLSSHNVNPSVLLEAGSVEFIKEYIMKGQGISFLYKPEIRLEATLGLLKPVAVKEGPIFVQTDTIFPKGADLSPPVKAFLQLIEEEA